MPNLAETVAAMARYRRAFTPPAPAANPIKDFLGTDPFAPAPPQGRLTQVADFGANPGALRMRLYTPQTLRPGAALVVVLHGCQQTADAYAEGAGWLTLADEIGFAVLCPEQVRSNNNFGCFNWFEPGDIARDQGEAASIRRMIAHALKNPALDPNKVFITGLSAGGAMTNVMLAAYPEVFAAGAVIAGLPYGAASNAQEAFAAMYQGGRTSAEALGDKVRAAAPRPRRWPRLSIWQGDADTTVRPENAAAIAGQWAQVRGLPSFPGQVTRTGGIERRVWLDGQGAAAIELVSIAGLGHGTPVAASGPDACGRPGPFILEAGVASSREIARFWGLAPGPAHAEAAPPPKAPPQDHGLHLPRQVSDLLKALGVKI